MIEKKTSTKNNMQYRLDQSCNTLHEVTGLGKKVVIDVHEVTGFGIKVVIHYMKSQALV